jgi:PAS domain S-box-containing protein
LQAQYQAVTDSFHEAVYIVDLQGQIVFCNAALSALTGCPHHELLGRPSVNLYVPAAHAELLERRAQALAGHAVPSLWVAEIRRKDGTCVPVELSVTNLLHAGQITGRITIVRDLTERRQAEERFRGLLEAAPDAMVIVNADGAIVLVNAQAERLFGYPSHELLGHAVELLVPERLRTTHLTDRRRYGATPVVRPMGSGLALYGRRKDGSEMPVEISLSPLQTAEGLLILTAIRDVTERQRTEDALRASLAEKEVLLQEIHHRVKNNLQIITSLLNLQASRIADPQITALFRESQNRVKAMALIHETLYRSGNLSALDFQQYVQELVRYLHRSYGLTANRIALQLEVARLPLTLNTAIPCGLILTELVSNACKYAFPHGATGTVRVEARQESSGRYLLRVADDGQGVPPDLDYTRSPSLGLQLVTNLVRQLHGEFAREPTARGISFVIHFWDQPHGEPGRTAPGEEGPLLRPSADAVAEEAVPRPGTADRGGVAC